MQSMYMAVSYTHLDVYKRQVVVAAFNYSLSDERQVVIPVEEIGLEKGQRCKVKDLWTKKVTECEDGYVRIKLIPAPVSYTHLCGWRSMTGIFSGLFPRCPVMMK